AAVIFSKPGCPHCARAKEILDRNGVVYEDVSLGKGITFSTIRAVSGQGTAPQVFIGGKLIGGADEVEAFFAKGQKKAA
ncbi:MAG: glutaredoxin domain-containing protein, partial [Usitatibacter sp.]